MLQLEFVSFPDLSTNRLFLRQLRTSDDTEIFGLRSDERVNAFLDRPKATTLDDARVFIEKINRGILNKEWFYWAITLKEETSENKVGKLIGTICLWNISAEKECAETGYELHPDYQGKGIMKEAMAAVIDFCFERLQLRRIEAFTHKDNGTSSRLLEKFHFKRDHDLEKEMQGREDFRNMTIYALEQSS